MAQLANCPACNSEFALPEEAGDATPEVRWAACPECDEVFSLADAKPHEVKQARWVDPPTYSEPNDEPDAEATDVDPAPKFGTATLASFLDDTDIDTDTKTPSSAPTLSDLPSLDELLRGDRTTADDFDPPEATVPPPDDSEPDAATTSSASLADEEPDELSPLADRVRPTLDETFDLEPRTMGDDASDAYDMVDEPDDRASEAEQAAAEVPDDEAFTSPPTRQGNDLSVPAEFDSTLRDLGDQDDTEVAASVPDAPAFDFEVSDSSAMPESKSLRAAMGFTDDDPLEVEDAIERPDFSSVETHDEGDQSPELSIATGETPQGKVAARKRGGVLAAARTLVGVAGGGVVGIAAGYLLLLWIFHFLGRSEEPLGLAKYYPDVVKPATFQKSGTGPIAKSENGPPSDDAEPTGESLTPMEDEGVETANYETATPPPADEEEHEPEPWEFTSDASPPALVDDAPLYTAAQLQELTAAGEEATAGLLAPGPLSKTKGSSYAHLAQLADALTFGEGAADVSWKHNARQVFPPLFDEAANREAIATIAGAWLDSPRRSHGGIFFSGRPDAGRQQGSVAEYTFTLPTGQKWTVLTPRALAVDTASAESVAVVGSVIDDPQKRIEGYTGDATQAIWTVNAFAVAE